MRTTLALTIMAAMLAITACSSQHQEVAPAATSSVPSLPAAGDLRAIKDQVEQNWNLGELADSPKLKDVVIVLRVHLQPDGTVTKVQVMNEQPAIPEVRQAIDNAIRAVMISSPLKLPPGEAFPTLQLRFHPDRVVE
jgi:hypothetical protein